MVSAASAQIEASGYSFACIHGPEPDTDVWPGLAAGNNLRTNIVVDGQLKNVPDYATVQGILIGTVAAYVLLVTIFGPEYVVRFSRSFICSSRGPPSSQTPFIPL
jgi:hypothetical protein